MLSKIFTCSKHINSLGKANESVYNLLYSEKPSTVFAAVESYIYCTLYSVTMNHKL